MDSFDPEQIRLLVGDTSPADKEEIRTGLSNNSIKIVIGTHALLEDPIIFADLQFVTIDEQHRFGVEQRAALRSKGTNPHLLVMTATPIPRSLALTLYGDLDLSVMDELPPGRQNIPTHILMPQERERAYTLVHGQVQSGHQAFIIYPLVEESENSELLAATQEHDRLQKEIFPDLKLGLLHGRMKPEDKDAVMLAFRDKQFDILVSTTVVEVGRGRSKCYRYAGGRRQPLRPGTTPPIKRTGWAAARPNRIVCWSRTMKMKPKMSVCKRWKRPMMDLCWPSGTCSSVVPVNSWALARLVMPPH